MKLAHDAINIESSGIQQEQSFSISDMGMVLEILRSKLYADPISAICREITCNARDAHREVGKGDLPIKIVLPTDLDANYRVMDFGPGISPDRMANVFIKFAASTKRNDNVQTGGFGLGAKTPFAYSDSFTIETVVDGIKTAYNAFIDPTKVGKLVMMHQVSTDQPNGTQIVIPVRREHYYEFATKTEQATRWWDVQPEIVGDYRTQRPAEANVIMSGTDWKIFGNKNDQYYNQEAQILVDGIAYKFDPSIKDGNSGYNNEDKPLNILFNGRKQLVVNFANGLLSLAANRESIHWNQTTKKIVSDRLHEIAEEIRVRLQSEIDKAEDYNAAVDKARELTKAFDVTRGLQGYFKWKGDRVVNGIDRSVASGVASTMHLYKTAYRNPQGLLNVDAKVDKSKGATWEFGVTNMIVVNDIGIQNLSPKRAIQILNMLPVTFKELTLVNEKLLDAKEIQDIRKYIPFVNLSDVVGKKDRKGSTFRKTRRLIYKKAGYGTFNLSSVTDFEEEKAVKVYVLLTRSYDNKMAADVEGLNCNTNEVIDYISSKFKVSVYGFEKPQFTADPESYEEFVDEAVPFKDFVETVALKDIDIPKLRAIALGWEEDRMGRNRGDYLANNVRDTLLALSKYVTGNTSAEFKEYADTFTSLSASRDEWQKVQRIAEFIKPDDAKKLVTKADPQFDTLKQSYASFIEKYPLLKHFWTQGAYIQDDLAKHLAEYINLKTGANNV